MYHSAIQKSQCALRNNIIVSKEHNDDSCCTFSTKDYNKQLTGNGLEIKKLLNSPIPLTTTLI